MSSVGVHHAARPLRFQLHALQQLLLCDKKKHAHRHSIRLAKSGGSAVAAVLESNLHPVYY